MGTYSNARRAIMVRVGPSVHGKGKIKLLFMDIRFTASGGDSIPHLQTRRQNSGITKAKTQI